MQKQRMLLLAALFLLSSWFAAAGNAGNRPILRIEKGNLSQTIEVQLANLQHQPTQVSLQDMDGRVWFSESVSGENGYTKKLDLKGMPAGRYICSIRHPNGQYARAFRFYESGVEFFERLNPGNFGAPLLVHTGGNRPCMVRLSAAGPKTLRLQLSNLQQQETRIRLCALEGGAVFQKKINKEWGYAENLNLNGLEPGRYVLDLKINHTQLIHYIQVSANTIQIDQQERLELKGDSALDTAQLEEQTDTGQMD